MPSFRMEQCDEGTGGVCVCGGGRGGGEIIVLFCSSS